MRSRDVWAEIAPQAGIATVQRGLLMAARRPEALAVLEAFAATDMGAECRLLGPREIAAYGEGLRTATSPARFIRRTRSVSNSRDAIPKLAAWLAEAHGVTFLRETAVRAVAPPRLETSRGIIEAEAAVVCPGDDFVSLYADRIAAYGLTRCKLHMLRLQPERYDPRLPVVMSDLGLVRYLGYAELPQAAALKTRLEAEQGRQLEHGVHLIVARSADGSLVAGDSHHYAATPDPFAPSFVDDLILEEYAAVYDGPTPPVVARWTGTYASAPDRLMLMDRPAEAVRIVLITSGTGASTSFAIAEETIADLYGAP